ncbi:UNVERIFIED_CONTAM: hypothetical protein KB579_08055 [Streptococcus canis]|uniref:hypothetical protein n=1 Tax=Streptococcus canis TaxID=1329 RepID=UPI0024DEC33D|nr:hypothetical protein [Streptococcus canis]
MLEVIKERGKLSYQVFFLAIAIKGRLHAVMIHVLAKVDSSLEEFVYIGHYRTLLIGFFLLKHLSVDFIYRKR